jgi:hypothetical protein
VAAEPEKLDSYQRDIAKGLEREFGEAEEIEVDPGTDRLALFSDLHRGARDGADDFLRCERAYPAALGYYLAAGYSRRSLRPCAARSDVQVLSQPERAFGAGVAA